MTKEDEDIITKPILSSVIISSVKSVNLLTPIFINYYFFELFKENRILEFGMTKPEN